MLAVVFCASIGSTYDVNIRKHMWFWNAVRGHCPGVHVTVVGVTYPRRQIMQFEMSIRNQEQITIDYLESVKKYGPESSIGAGECMPTKLVSWIDYSAKGASDRASDTRMKSSLRCQKCLDCPHGPNRGTSCLRLGQVCSMLV